MQYRVRLTDEATKMLRSIGRKYGKKTYEILRDLIRDLESEPQKKGFALRGKLAGFWSLHYSRFRVIYRIDDGRIRVVVVRAGYYESGSRRDIYAVLERLSDSGLIDINAPDDV